jgi:hypothetical protein
VSLNLLVDGRLLGRKASAPLSSNVSAPLDIDALLLRAKVTGGKQVELILLPVHRAVREVERDTSDEGDDSHTTVVPGKVGIRGKRRESLGKRSREGGGEELDGLNERSHVLGSLGEGVLERRHGGEDLGNGDQDVHTGYGPDGDVGLILWVVRLVVAGRLVNVVLQDGGPDHGEGTKDETGGDLLDGGEPDALLAEERVDERVHDWHDDDNGNLCRC